LPNSIFVVGCGCRLSAESSYPSLFHAKFGDIFLEPDCQSRDSEERRLLGHYCYSQCYRDRRH